MTVGKIYQINLVNDVIIIGKVVEFKDGSPLLDSGCIAFSNTHWWRCDHLGIIPPVPIVGFTEKVESLSLLQEEEFCRMKQFIMNVRTEHRHVKKKTS